MVIVRTSTSTFYQKWKFTRRAMGMMQYFFKYLRKFAKFERLPLTLFNMGGGGA